MPNKNDILKLEHEFWKTMAAGEHGKSAKLLAPTAGMMSPMGFQSFSPKEYVKMGESSGASYVDYSMSDEEVMFPTPDTAIVNYHVKQTTKDKDGKLETIEATDATIWAKDGDDWKCIFHSQMPANGARASM